jgi:meiotically up-regulated gene 157 (Mug157) protein
MWLRDSTNQFIPYIRMPQNCEHIPALTRGLLNFQSEFILIDTYTNAFKRFENSTTQRPSYLN